MHCPVCDHTLAHFVAEPPPRWIGITVDLTTPVKSFMGDAESGRPGVMFWEQKNPNMDLSVVWVKRYARVLDG